MTEIFEGDNITAPHNAAPNAAEKHAGDFVTYTNYGFRKVSHPNQTPHGIAFTNTEGKLMIQRSCNLTIPNVPTTSSDNMLPVLGSDAATMKTTRTSLYPSGASVGIYLHEGIDRNATKGIPAVHIDPTPATGHCVLIKEDPDGIHTGEPVVLGIKDKRFVAIAAIDVANDNPATPVGVVVGRDYEGSVYVCTDGQCRMTANGLFEFLPESVEEAPVGARLSRRGAVIPIDHEVKNATSYGDYYTLGTLLEPFRRDEQRFDTVLIDVHCSLSLAKIKT